MVAIHRHWLAPPQIFLPPSIIVIIVIIRKGGGKRRKRKIRVVWRCLPSPPKGVFEVV